MQPARVKINNNKRPQKNDEPTSNVKDEESITTAEQQAEQLFRVATFGMGAP